MLPLANRSYGVVSVLASYHAPYKQMSTAIQGIAEAALLPTSNAIKKKEAAKKLRVFHFGVCGFQDPKTYFTYQQTIASAISPWEFGPAIVDH